MRKFFFVYYVLLEGERIIDQGGSISQRGFSFQNAVIILTAIKNYKKENFKMFIESEDDFEVEYSDSYHAYIQVKGHKKVSFKKLMNHKNGKSIIEKNLINGDVNSIHKIVVFNFSNNDLKEMKRVYDDELFEKGFKFSDKQKKIIEDLISYRDLTLIVTKFDDDLDESVKYLLGEMSENNILIDNHGENMIKELFFLVNEKSIIVQENDEDRERKKVDRKDFIDIFNKTHSLQRFDKILDSLNYSELNKILIKKARNTININHSHKRMEVKQNIQVDKLLGKDEEDTINTIMQMNDFEDYIDENEKIAICISAYCDVVEEIINEPCDR